MFSNVMGHYPSGVWSPFGFGRQTITPCFWCGVRVLCRNIWFSSSCRSVRMVSQCAV